MKRKIIVLGLCIVALVFLGIGIFLKQYDSVLIKAINICLECIGIG